MMSVCSFSFSRCCVLSCSAPFSLLGFHACRSSVTLTGEVPTQRDQILARLGASPTQQKAPNLVTHPRAMKPSSFVFFVFVANGHVHYIRTLRCCTSSPPSVCNNLQSRPKQRPPNLLACVRGPRVAMSVFWLANFISLAFHRKSLAPVFF